ncbi:hypothetical protein ABQE19_12805 [Enterococcus thailandicus]|uniref:hypothetical protein n=1 Tax=Enterococcus thailandicus TaxID=417368 RepID=UPI0032E4AEAD
MKSTKQIADILGVSKMTVYRFIKSNNITETSQDGRTLLYDDTSVNLILKGLSDKTDVTDVTPDDTSDFKEDYVIKLEEMNVFLKKEIEDKNNQIESLQTILNQQQQLLLYEQQKNTKLLEENIENKRWWQWWK